MVLTINFITTMKHSSLLLLFLILAALIILVFIYIYSTSLKADTNSKGVQKPQVKRFFFITILFGVLVILLSVTLPKSPYYLFASEQPDAVVHVASGQYYFLMSTKNIDPQTMELEGPVLINQGDLIEFRVTSFDVNHGFAIYDSENNLIAQTQAMPGYINRLRWRFEEPGLYNVFCLEFCGMGHQAMRTTFTVN